VGRGGLGGTHGQYRHYQEGVVSPEERVYARVRNTNGEVSFYFFSFFLLTWEALL